MKNRSLIKTKAPLIFLMSLAPLLSGCQLSHKPESPAWSIIYGAYESDKKSLFLSDEEGQSRLKITSATLSDGYPSVSPNGKRVAFYGKYDDFKTWSIHTVNIDGTNVQRLTETQHVWDSAPDWSPDGNTIVFAREYPGPDGKRLEEIWLMDPDGSNKRQLTSLEGRSPCFMPDGRILFQSKSPSANIFIANIDGTGVIQLTDTDSNDYSPKISPSGKQVAFLANRDGNQEVYVMNIDGSEQTRLTFNRIDEWGPFWSGDGSRIFFSSQSTHGFYDIFVVNKDGSEMRKVIDGGSQGASINPAVTLATAEKPN